MIDAGLAMPARSRRALLSTPAVISVNSPWSSRTRTLSVLAALARAPIRQDMHARLIPSTVSTQRRRALSFRAVRVLALIASIALGCARSEPERIELTVYAATSLRDPLQELAPEFEKSSGARITFDFGSSGDLARQILAADQADVFLSADEVEMDRVAREGRIDPATRRVLLSNRLVVIEPVEFMHEVQLFRQPFATEDLASSAIEHFSIGDPALVPAGRYAKAWLATIGVWDRVESRVLPAIDARAALAAVESGAARAGIVYKTDALRSQKVHIVYTVPDTEAPKTSYPIAVLAQRPHAELAQRFVDFMATRAASELFERYGFIAQPSR